MFKAGKYKPLGAWPMWKRRYPWHAHEQAGDSRESHSQGLGLGRQPLLHALTLLEAAQPSMRQAGCVKHSDAGCLPCTPQQARVCTSAHQTSA